jgi:hypothetical protein
MGFEVSAFLAEHCLLFTTDFPASSYHISPTLVRFFSTGCYDTEQSVRSGIHLLNVVIATATTSTSPTSWTSLLLIYDPPQASDASFFTHPTREKLAERILEKRGRNVHICCKFWLYNLLYRSQRGRISCIPPVW